MSNEQQNGSVQMFRELHQRFGANFFLTMFLVMLFAYAYAQNRLTECQSDAVKQEQRFSEDMKREQEKTIVYLKEQKDKIDILYQEAKRLKQKVK
jgi:hypothetical protein